MLIREKDTTKNHEIFSLRKAHENQITNLARGAMPLALPNSWPCSLTGTPLFPAAIAAVWLVRNNDTSNYNMYIHKRTWLYILNSSMIVSQKSNQTFFQTKPWHKPDRLP